MASDSRYLREGVIAGLIGAALVAVWFLIYDAAMGRPFRTPSLLGAATFQGVTDPSTVPTAAHLVVQYTVLHGVVFALIGVLIAYLIVSAQSAPSRVLTLFIALMCFEVFFLAVVTWLAHPVLGELAWWTILAANALAAGGMLIYFFVGHRALGRALLGPLWTRVVREGIVGGLLGAVGVALWFLAYDAAAGAPLRTPALLGAALFHGLREPGALVITMPLVLQYTVVHSSSSVSRRRGCWRWPIASRVCSSPSSCCSAASRSSSRRWWRSSPSGCSRRSPGGPSSRATSSPPS